ncbi:hypothetical protein V1521DRAFT_416975 [Lipomyces starkeyi]
MVFRRHILCGATWLPFLWSTSQWFVQILGVTGVVGAHPHNHEPHSKRVMAQDMVNIMRLLGFNRFSVAGHDRGDRVAYRMALDHPEIVEKLAVTRYFSDQDDVGQGRLSVCGGFLALVSTCTARTATRTSIGSRSHYDNR